MFGIFNKKAKVPAPSGHDIGAGSDLAAIRLAAQAHCDWSRKAPLLQGCIAAFQDNRPENLRAFIMSYLEFKRSNGNVAELHEGGMDVGFIHLIARPVLHEIERHQNPDSVLETLSAEMSPFYKQLMLDLLLREACATDGWMMAEVLIKAGADVNTGLGRPLANAGRERNLRIANILIAHGADIDMARAVLINEDRQANLEAFNATMAMTKKPDAPAPQTPSPEREDAPAKLHITARTPIKKPAAE